jgi:hypothetical protein
MPMLAQQQHADGACRPSQFARGSMFTPLDSCYVLRPNPEWLSTGRIGPATATHLCSCSSDSSFCCSRRSASLSS